MVYLLCRGTHDLAKRAKLLQETKYKGLKIGVKEKMVRNPNRGLVSSKLRMRLEVDHFEGKI